MTLTFVVDAVPPWKQIPADEAEKRRQEDRKKALQERAKKALRVAPLSTPCTVSIRYFRKEGRSDSANIIGGVLNSLQNIIFKNDNQVVEISYTEWPGSRDWYQVTVTELARRQSVTVGKREDKRDD